MSLSKTIRVFERSLIKSEKLFTLISEVKSSEFKMNRWVKDLLQIVFLQAAEVCLLASGQRAASLFTLVLYNCLIFSVNYVISIVNRFSYL